jgi:YVTN family beta-propeller protein
MAELPSGTVTFLFTDIEGSTALLTRLRGRYGDVLAEHERILRDAIERNGGQVVDTQGDALFAAFPRATAAAAAAVAGQRALAAQPWPDGETVRVRMGLHSGEPAVGSDRYVGLGVHRAARISAAAHGGQILMSGVTRALVEDDLPDDVRISDLGEYRLKDLDRPERLYQLVATDLPSEFPPPRTDEVDPDAVALAEAVTRRRLVPGRRTAIALAAATLVVVGLAAYLATSGGSPGATVVAADSVGFIDGRSGRVTSQIEVDHSPTSVAVERDGAVWTADANAGTASRIDPSTGAVGTIPVGASPSGIAIGGGGVWVANHDDNTVSWINQQSDQVVGEPIRVGAGPTAIAYGFRSVWVTNADDRTVTRIKAATGEVQKTIPTNAAGGGIAVGGGSVWVTDESSHSVLGIDPMNDRVTSTATVGAGPIGIAYGDRSLWVANSLDGTVSRVNAATGRQQALITVPGGPSSVSFSRGTVWVSAEFGARVVRIDPRRNAIAGSTPIGNQPQGLAAGGGGAWVAVQASGRSHRGGRLVVVGGSIDTIDPALPNSEESVALLGTAYDGLTSFRRTGGVPGSQIVPDLAAALPQPIDGGKTYTFHLRPGIRYSDGRPVSAADFRRGLERVLELGGPAAPFFTGLAGAEGCIEHLRKHTPCDLSRSVTVQGRSTLTFRLSAPDPRLFFELTGVDPVPPGTPLHDVGTKPVPSTGPYAIRSYTPNRLLTLVRNRYFRSWSAAARPDGYPDEIDYRVLAGVNVQVKEVLGGKADLVFEGNLTGGRIEQLEAHYPRQVHLDPQQATTFVFLNVKRAPFDDVRVRRAINSAVDRGQVAALHGAPLAQLTCQTVPPTLPGYRPYCPYTVAPDAAGDWKAPNLAKAHALIRASGTRGEKVVVWSTAYFHAESVYFVSLLRQLGYRARLHYIPDINRYFGSLAKTPSAQAGFGGWFGVGLAADMFSELECGTGPNNWAHFCDPQIDAQVARLAKTEPLDPAGTTPLAARIDRELTDAAPWVPLFTPRLPDLTSRRVGNYQVNTGIVLLDQLWVR